MALARALAKSAPLMLLDEPLVNLDYKLREELREELTQLFATGDSTVVYATTEPAEALLLGGYTAVLDAGELLQYGPTAEVFHRAEVDPRRARLQRPADEPDRRRSAARPACSSTGGADARRCALPAARSQARHASACAPARCASQARAGDVALPGKVELAEISGSDTFVHVDTRGRRAGGAAHRRAPLRRSARRSRCTSTRRRSMCSTRPATCCVAPAGSGGH